MPVLGGLQGPGFGREPAGFHRPRARGRTACGRPGPGSALLAGPTLARFVVRLRSPRTVRGGPDEPQSSACRAAPRRRRPASPEEDPGPLRRSTLTAGDRERLQDRALHPEPSRTQGHRVIKCNLGEPDFPLPRAHPRRGEAADRQRHDALLRPAGPPAAARGDRARHGRARAASRSRPDRVVVFAGRQAADRLLRSRPTATPATRSIYPSPGFPIYESFTALRRRRAGARCSSSERDGFSFTGQRARAAASAERTQAHLPELPVEPDGRRRHAATQLEEIAEVIRRARRRRTRGSTPTRSTRRSSSTAPSTSSIASMPGMEERTIIVSGVSKTYSWTGGRVGLGRVPDRRGGGGLQEPQHQRTTPACPPYNQMGAKVAIESPESPPEIARMVAAFQERRDLVVRGLNAIAGITCQKPKGAFYVFPNIAGVCRALGADRRLASACPAAVTERTSPATLFQMLPALPLPRRDDGPSLVRARSAPRAGTTCGCRSPPASTT